ncbi:semaphorin-5B-like [Argiope bruennichi]|uniref:semaphorin-5B-like n=1 Tax=Argiope bruennichi TaxID=94029 RepID=UPI002495A3E7|nr:semaphorin-5B-like [Argiope bruennichi]XP_055944139.1 semaphorin-5B-like [Argiope bruennichi]
MAMALKSRHITSVLLRTLRCLLLLGLLFKSGFADPKLITREDLRTGIDVFTQSNVKSFGQLLFDIQRYQLIVGSRNYLFRLSLEGLKKLEESYWPANADNIHVCLLKGKSEEDCMNYIKVLVSHGNKLFACGTNAFMPECSWRLIDALNNIEWVPGEAKCPYNPYANSTALITSKGDYYIASTIDFSGRDPVIFKVMGKQPLLRTVQFDPKWLSDANFVASYEIDNFTYYFFREAAVEYINCGKVIYSRVARICKNDQGGQFLLKDKFTTFLKARLNCSIPGNYPFYYNEIQSVHYIEREEIFYATFTTPVNSIYGTAICAYNMTAIKNSFNGAFKYQEKPNYAWERQTSPHRHFQCEVPKKTAEHVLDSEKYQLMNEAVQPMTSHPILRLELERFSHIVVDTVQTKEHDSVHVMFVASVEGIIRKLVILPDTKETCLIEKIQVFPEGSTDTIKVMKLLKDTNSLYIGTEESVLRIPVQRCEKKLSRSECLSSMDPYCGWDIYKLACIAAPHRNPLSAFWHQEKIACPKTDTPVDGGWSAWTSWHECSQIGHGATGDRCKCQKRFCNNPTPANGGKECEGTSVHVTNCTRDGHWTEWSAWSSCSQTCGLSIKTRRRICGNPAPAFGGKICIGPEKDEIFCTANPPCPAATVSPIDGHWSEWSTWEECSAPCGGGIQVRRRRCNSPPPQHGGKECIGCNQDYKFCNLQSCPEVKKSTPWTPYLRVNQTKDGYFEQRLRFTCRANVPDESMLKIGHMKKEERFCHEGSRNCLDSAFLSIDGGWSVWSPWSYCSASCGGGVQYRERFCDSPKPAGSGADCHGPARVDRPCNIESCSDFEGWEPWSVWSLCDENQEQQRKRKCKISMTPSSYCSGPTKEIRMCIPSQINPAASSDFKSKEDGIHAEHIVAGFVVGLFIGVFLSAIGFYVYMKRRGNPMHSRVATQLIPVKPNTYVDGNEWKNNYSNTLSQKIPLREAATIKRNGSIRTQLQSENF